MPTKVATGKYARPGPRVVLIVKVNEECGCNYALHGIVSIDKIPCKEGAEARIKSSIATALRDTSHEARESMKKPTNFTFSDYLRGRPKHGLLIHIIPRPKIGRLEFLWMIRYATHTWTRFVKLFATAPLDDERCFRLVEFRRQALFALQT